MKTELETQDIEAIALRVLEMLRPHLDGSGKAERGDDILDVPGLAEYLNVSNKWIYERTHLNEIPHIKMGGKLRFRKRDIDKWLDSTKVPAVSTPKMILRAVR